MSGERTDWRTPKGRWGVLMIPPTKTNRFRKSDGVRAKEPVAGDCRTHGERGGFPHSFPGGTPCVLRNVNSHPVRTSTCSSALGTTLQILRIRNPEREDRGEDIGQGHMVPEANSLEVVGDDKGSLQAAKLGVTAQREDHGMPILKGEVMLNTRLETESGKDLRKAASAPAGSESHTEPKNRGDIWDLTKAWVSKRLEAAELEASVSQRMTEFVDRLASEILGIKAAVGRVESNTENLAQGLEATGCHLESLESERQKQSQQIANISQAIGALERNLEQVRLLVARTAERVDKLSNEFVEREVKEPLLKDIGTLYHAMREAMINESDGIRSVAEYARALLESRGASLIEPEQGDRFNPGEHRPIEMIPTSCKSLERSIAKLCRVGLRFNGRVIQPAWVALYTTQQKDT